MGVTISYRGTLGDRSRIEDFEDRVLDLALEVGGQARIWRTANDDDPRRVVRGIILNLFPGQETTSLLVSPEGWLIGLHEIEEAERGELAGPPWCFVKTQFGPVEGHVALVELFTVLKKEFFPDLEVSDEGDYWQTRDLARLTAKMQYLQSAIDGLAEGLSRYPLSPEAAEDREILAAQIQRIAELVHRTLGRPAEHPPVHWDDEEPELDPAADQSRWDAEYKENRRRQEHVHRAIEEHLARGDDYDEAFDAAMLEETAAGLPEDPSESEAINDWEEELEAEAADEDEPWRESLDSPACDHEEEDFGSREHHPLQQRASDLLLRLYELLEKGSESAGSHAAGGHRDVLLNGAGEMGGGLAQALGSDDWEPLFGLAVVQLKRALRGAAFAVGALYPLRADGTLDPAAFDELHATLDGLQTDIYAELTRVRQRHAGEL